MRWSTRIRPSALGLAALLAGLTSFFLTTPRDTRTEDYITGRFG